MTEVMAHILKYCPDLKKIFDVFTDRGYRLYLVGGCVRDCFLKKTNFKDIDLTTDAKPKEIKKILKDIKFKVYDIGEKFGTIGTIVNDISVEITTFRAESDYEDNRHPSKIFFSNSLEKDLSRRDFTINAIAASDNTIIDIYNGYRSILHKEIKTVNNAKERFIEDPLRIMRGLRFASKLNFEIEENTDKAIHKYAYMLEKISSERIQDELMKILKTDNAPKILLLYQDVFAVIIPELKKMINFDQKNKYHYLDCYEHTIMTIANIASKHPLIRLAGLFHDLGKPECTTEIDNVRHFYGHPKISAKIAKQIMERLHYSVTEIKLVTTLIKFHDRGLSGTKKNTKRLIAALSKEVVPELLEPTFYNLMELRKADMLAHSKRYHLDISVIDKTISNYKQIVEENEAFSLRQLDMTGNDLIKIGFASGPIIGDVLNNCLNAVINNEIKNDKKELITFSKQFLVD